ncbi:hypothetical protein NMY22_g10168 [Coprinellus aureogranulatus]|nr:hypothetical protein NMY22_g10168 [Coprinellus aureogranulatus]
MAALSKGLPSINMGGSDVLCSRSLFADRPIMNSDDIPKVKWIFRHKAGITVARISPDGSLLLSGDGDGTTIVWDIRTGKSLQTFALGTSHGITAAAWCPFSSCDPAQAFAIGEAGGQVTIYRKETINYDYASSIQVFAEVVEDIAYDTQHKRFAVVGAGCLKVFDLSATYTTSLVHATAPRTATARCTGFYDDGASVFVCYLESQHITGYAISPWMVQFDGDLETRIGHAARGQGGDLFVTNLRDGMDVYSFPPTPVPRRTIRFHIERNYPLTVAVSPVAGFAVVGGEDGHARVYDIRHGIVDSMLSHGNCTGIFGSRRRELTNPFSTAQLTKFHDHQIHASPTKCLVVTGCADDNDGSLKIWAPDIPRTPSRGRNPSTKDDRSRRMSSFPIFILLAAAAVLVVAPILLRSAASPWAHIQRQVGCVDAWVRAVLRVSGRAWWRD